MLFYHKYIKHCGALQEHYETLRSLQYFPKHKVVITKTYQIILSFDIFQNKDNDDKYNSPFKAEIYIHRIEDGL